MPKALVIKKTASIKELLHTYYQSDSMLYDPPTLAFPSLTSLSVHQALWSCESVALHAPTPKAEAVRRAVVPVVQGPES